MYWGLLGSYSVPVLTSVSLPSNWIFPVYRHGSTIVAAFLNSWTSFDAWWRERSAVDLKQSILMILKKLLILDSTVCTAFFSLFPAIITCYIGSEVSLDIPFNNAFFL